MDVGDLAVNEPTDEDVVRITYCTRCAKNLTSSGMSPPTSTEFFASYGFSQGWNGSSATLKNNAMLFYESKRFIRG
jgi:hypothetical protein